MMEGNNLPLSFYVLNAWSSYSLSEGFSCYKLSMALFCIVNFCTSSVSELGDGLDTPGSVSSLCMENILLEAVFFNIESSSRVIMTQYKFC